MNRTMLALAIPLLLAGCTSGGGTEDLKGVPFDPNPDTNPETLTGEGSIRAEYQVPYICTEDGPMRLAASWTVERPVLPHPGARAGINVTFVWHADFPGEDTLEFEVRTVNPGGLEQVLDTVKGTSPATITMPSQLWPSDQTDLTVVPGPIRCTGGQPAGVDLLDIELAYAYASF